MDRQVVFFVVLHSCCYDVITQHAVTGGGAGDAQQQQVVTEDYYSYLSPTAKKTDIMEPIDFFNLLRLNDDSSIQQYYCTPSAHLWQHNVLFSLFPSITPETRPTVEQLLCGR